MKTIIVKVIAFIAVFLFMEGVVLQWAISNNTMPLWVDLLLVTILLMILLAGIDRLAFHLFKLLGQNDELPKEGA